jgi:hypothetical protein
MGDNNEFLNRAMSGDLHEIIKERTDFNMKGVIDALPLFQLDRLKKYAKKKGRLKAVAILERAEIREILKQQSDLKRAFRSDISLIGSTIGNKEPSKGVNDDII